MIKSKSLLAIVTLFLLSFGCKSAPEPVKTSQQETLAFTLQKTLTTYFQKSLGEDDIIVENEILRKSPGASFTAPTQVYSWVQVREKSGRLMISGALKGLSPKINEFSVTDFLPSKIIRENFKEVYKNFPSGLTDSIIARAAAGQ